jgi:two-component system, OmpR family, phosphate regulon sensor histidine kinase PhoR
VDTGELERKAEIAELLLDAARQLAESLDPERVYERFQQLLADSVPHDGIVVSSYDEDAGLIRCEYAWVDGNRLDPATLPPLELNREGGGMQSRVIMTGEPLLANDVAERVRGEGTYYDVDREGRMRKLPHGGPPGTRAAMMVPVELDGRVVGVMQLMSDRVAYAPDDLMLVEGLVGQLAAAVRNARLQEERRRLEAAEAAALAAAAEREQAAHVLGAVGDGVFLVDREGRVRFWNRAAALVTGVPGERVSGRPAAEVFADWPALADAIPVAGSGVPRSVTLPARLPSRDLWLSFVAVESSDGVVYAFRDVTSERRLEEAKSDLVATISHELRTPLAAVYGAAETLLRREGDLDLEQRHRLLRMIASQAERLSQITSEVLLATQLDRGAVAVDRACVDVVEVVRLAVETVEGRTGESTAFAVDAPADGAAARGDADRVQQVLVNLLDNAAKYGGGHVAVRVEAKGPSVRIAVEDTGPGISASEQERVFDKFYRGGHELTRAPGGTGLGLYIARELVHRMDGELTLSSELGSGSTFTVELPVA